MAFWRRGTRFGTSDDLFQAVRDLIGRLDAAGHPAAATELREGFGCLNGLTDGWALFLESIEKVRADSRPLEREDRKVLDAIRAAVRAAVYRR